MTDPVNMDPEQAPGQSGQAAGSGENPAPGQEEAHESVDVEALMRRIRSQVKEAYAGGRPPLARYGHPAAQLSEPSETPILYSEELNYLNARWNTWGSNADFASHRRLLGPLIVRIKRALRSFLCEGILRSYFDAEREYQMQLVRYLNGVARYIDARDRDIFWQLIRKQDNDLQTANARVDELFQSAFDGCAELESNFGRRAELLESTCRGILEQLDDVQGEVGRQQKLADALRGEIGILREACLSALSGSESGRVLFAALRSRLLWESADAHAVADFRKRLQQYVLLFKDAEKQVLDIGGADGSFLESLRDSGVPGRCITSNPAAAAVCRERNLETVEESPSAYLARMDDSSAGGIFISAGPQGVPGRDAAAIARAAVPKLCPGALLVLDTGLCAAGEDPPPPEQMSRMLQAAGAEVLSTDLFAGAWAPDKMRELPAEQHLPPKWREVVQRLNDLTRLLQCQRAVSGYRILARRSAGNGG